MNNHFIKIKKEHYNNVRAGTKTFEIRNNDRAYQKGDALTMYLTNEAGHDCTSGNYPRLIFSIGDVYPIDSERVVFSLLPEKGPSNG